MWQPISNPATLFTMQITVQLPDDLTQHPNPGREALEALVIEGYRAGTLSHAQSSQMLGLTRFEFDGFLKDRKIYDHSYNVEDFEQDLETLRQFKAKGMIPS
jgi:predicted HTH domain antitoxin